MKRRRIVTYSSDEEDDSGLACTEEIEPGSIENETYTQSQLISRHNFGTFVSRLEKDLKFREKQIKTYGKSVLKKQKCQNCNLEVELRTKGVQIIQGKSKLILEDEKFTECPNCGFNPELSHYGNLREENPFEEEETRTPTPEIRQVENSFLTLPGEGVRLLALVSSRFPPFVRIPHSYAYSRGIGLVLFNVFFLLGLLVFPREGITNQMGI